MQRFKAALCSALVFITISTQKLYAEVPLARPEPLFTEILKNMPFYIEYLVQAHRFFWSLEPKEREQLQLLNQYLKNLGRTPDANFSRLREDFILQIGEPERAAVTTEQVDSKIDFNVGLLEKNQVDIPLGIQLSMHELGHKLADQKDQGVFDSLATKAAIFFKAYTQTLKISPQESLHVLSLPIQWFQWNTQIPWNKLRHRPNTAVFLKTSQANFHSLTEQVLSKIEGGAGQYEASGPIRDKAFTDIQTFLLGLDRSKDGPISIFVRTERKLQSDEKPKLPFTFPEEPYSKNVTDELQLFFHFGQQVDVQVVPTSKRNLASSIRTTLEQELNGAYRLTLPDFKVGENMKLQLSTALGPILLSQEQTTDPEKPLSFLFQIPKEGLAEFVEIQSILKENQIQFLDKSYWFAIPKGPQGNLEGENIQMQVGEEWKEVKANSEDPFYNRWGASGLKIEVPNSKKIRHIRFVWGMQRSHFKSSDIKRPQFYQPMGPTQFVLRAEMGDAYAFEKDIYEENFSESEFTQEGSQLTVPLKFSPKHIINLSFTSVTHRISRFFTLRSNITNHEIKGEDMGQRHLLDILITDENLETTSILKEPMKFHFTSSGRSPCEEMMEKYNQYSSHYE